MRSGDRTSSRTWPNRCHALGERSRTRMICGVPMSCVLSENRAYHDLRNRASHVTSIATLRDEPFVGLGDDAPCRASATSCLSRTAKIARAGSSRRSDQRDVPSGFVASVEAQRADSRYARTTGLAWSTLADVDSTTRARARPCSSQRVEAFDSTDGSLCRRSPSSGGSRRSWTRRRRCGPSAAPPSPSSTRSRNPSSSRCSATRRRIRRGGRRATRSTSITLTSGVIGRAPFVECSCMHGRVSYRWSSRYRASTSLPMRFRSVNAIHQPTGEYRQLKR